MSDVFKDGCNAFNSYLVDDYEDPDNLIVIANFDMDYVKIVGEKMACYAAHAIKNHDHLTQENQQLREALAALVKSKQSDIYDFNEDGDEMVLVGYQVGIEEMKSAKQLLSKLEAKDA